MSVTEYCCICVTRYFHKATDNSTVDGTVSDDPLKWKFL